MEMAILQAAIIAATPITAAATTTLPAAITAAATQLTVATAIIRATIRPQARTITLLLRQAPILRVAAITESIIRLRKVK